MKGPEATGEPAWDLKGREEVLSYCFSVLRQRDENAVLRSVAIALVESLLFALRVLTQLAFGSRNLHQTPSSRTSFILRQRFKKTPSIRFRKSIIPISSLALVGLAA